MTPESYKRARDILDKLKLIDNSIKNLRHTGKLAVLSDGRPLSISANCHLAVKKMIKADLENQKLALESEFEKL